MSLRLLRLVVATGVLTLAIELGKLVDGDVRAGLPLCVIGLVLARVPAGLLVRQVISNWTTDFSRSPAMADPALRRSFRSAGVLVTAWPVTLVGNLRLRMLNARVVEYERQARAPRPEVSADLGTSGF